MSIRIPLSSVAQKFSITLGKYFLSFTLIYRDAVDGGAWYLDIATSDGSIAIYGMPLVCGVDLLAQFQHRGLGHLTARVIGQNSVSVPTYSDMGSNIELLWDEA